MVKTIYDFTATNINGQETSLAIYKDKVLLIVNTASKCGFTKQYQALQELSVQFADQLVILAFPCNQFGNQEPGNDSEILTFCTINYNITFPLFSKINVNGKDAHPLFSYLKDSLPGALGSKMIKWNFTKFLVDKHGQPYKRFAPQDPPASLVQDIQYLVQAS